MVRVESLRSRAEDLRLPRGADRDEVRSPSCCQHVDQSHRHDDLHGNQRDDHQRMAGHVLLGPGNRSWGRVIK